MKQVLPRLERPQRPGRALSALPPLSLLDPKLYLVLMVLVDAGVDGGVGMLRSLLVFSMAPVDGVADVVGPFEVDVDGDDITGGALMVSPEVDLARAELVLQSKRPIFYKFVILGFETDLNERRHLSSKLRSS